MTFPDKIGVWQGEDLKGDWEVTTKIDGVRAIWTNFGTHYGGMGYHWMSRAGKELLNLPVPLGVEEAVAREEDVHFELYLGSLKDTVRACRTKHLKPDTPRIEQHHLYRLDPVDVRLRQGVSGITDPTADEIRSWLKMVNSEGFEGLVLRQGDKWLKVKPFDTLDLRVTGYEEGKGKHVGRLGFLITKKGKVGTGFSDAQRQVFWNQRHRLIGTTIEVECMQMTPAGVMRHSRFIRERFDKVADE